MRDQIQVAFLVQRLHCIGQSKIDTMGSGVSKPLSAENVEEKKKKVAKIPLNIALVAIVKIQVRFRMRLARRRFEEVRVRVLEERRLEELARRLKVPERDETTPMKTGAVDYVGHSEDVNVRNRFIRKAAPAEHNVKFAAPHASTNSRKPAAVTDLSLILEKYSLADSTHCIISPLVGFVVKSRCNATGRKIFFNICHHETIVTMVCAPVREVSDTAATELLKEMSSSRRPSFSLSGRPFSAMSMTMFNNTSGNFETAEHPTVLVADIVLPSAEFEECFAYNDDEGLVPISAAVRKEMARQAIKFWNITNNDDISGSFTFPRIKRGYFGDLLPMTLDLKYKTVAHLPSALRACDTLTNGTAVSTAAEGATTSPLGVPPPPEASAKEQFRLPYAAPLGTWADVATVGTRVALVDNAVPKDSLPPNALALVEPTKARKCATSHPLMFTCRELPAGVVEYVVPAPAPTVRIPLFGPAYAAQLLTEQQETEKPDVFKEGSADPATASAPTVVPVDPTVGAAKAATAPTPAAPTGVPTAASSSFMPHMPTGHKPTRSMTMSAATGPAGGHRHLSGPTVGSAWTKAAATAAATVSSSDSTSKSDPAVPAAAVQPTAPAGDSSAGTGVMGTLSEQESAQAVVKAQLNAELLISAPNECNTTLPVYIVLSGGVLYLFNRDPLRRCYFPRNATRPAPKEPDPKTGLVDDTQGDPVASRDDPLPLVSYGRIMLTEDCVSMSSATIDGVQTWSIHIRPHRAETVSAEDTIVLLYTQLSDAFRGAGGVTLTLRSFSEFRTWKAHLRTQIQVGTAVRKRVLQEYMAALDTAVNGQPVSGSFDTKAGEVVMTNGRHKRFIKVENGLLYVYEAKHPEEYAGRNLLSIVELTRAVTRVRNELLDDNSSENILTVLDAEGNVLEGCEFVFHKPYAMDEPESRKYCEALKQHAQLAHTRQSAYLLPLVESQHGAVVVNEQSSVVTVKLAVSGSEEMDSDDEDGDETEHALRKHTLLTILYLSHPQPLQEVRRKVELALSPENNSGVEAGQSMGSPVTQAATANVEGLVFPTTATAALVHSIDEQAAIDQLAGAIPTESGAQPAVEAVLVGKKLYFYHRMAFCFSLDVTHCGDKAAFRAARAWEKMEFAEVKQQVLKEREKLSVFYLDSSSDEEGEGEGGSELGSFDLPLSRINSRGSLMTPLPPATPPYSASQPTREGASRRRGRKLRGQPQRQVKSIDAAAPAVQEPLPVYIARPRILAESKAPPNYPIRLWVIQLVCYDNRSYTLKFKCEEEYQTWRALLFSAGRDVSETAYLAKLPPPSCLAPTAEHMHSSGADGDGGADGYDSDKEDMLQRPETTSSLTDLATGIDGMAVQGDSQSRSSFLPLLGGAAKIMERGYDLDTTRKFARMLRKDEKVLASGLVLRHDTSAQGGKTSSTAAAKQRRILLLTDNSRLLFLDPVGNIVRGALDLSAGGGAQKVDVRAANNVDFEVIIGSTGNKFTALDLPDKNASFWAAKIKHAISQR